jgi:predicted exporter
VRVGITGEVPLADEEFASIREGMGLIGLGMLAAMLACLWLATRSAKTVAAIMVTIIAGLVITLALGLLTVGRLNLISVAFIPLFVGLGVDFGIQVAVRFNHERRAGAAPMEALERMAAAIGEPLSLAAAAIFLALGAFLPTDYIGIAELGVIAGMGMVVAFALNITLLPALLMLRPPCPPRSGLGRGRAARCVLHRHRRDILIAFVGAMLLSVVTLVWVVRLQPAASAQSQQSGDARIVAVDEGCRPHAQHDHHPDPQCRCGGRAGKAVWPQGSGPRHHHRQFRARAQGVKLALISDASLLLDATINPFDFPPPAMMRQRWPR